MEKYECEVELPPDYKRRKLVINAPSEYIAQNKIEEYVLSKLIVDEFERENK